jgi:hypothetical protein
MLKLLSKAGVFVLALLLVALPVAACVFPGAGMTAAEQNCCKEDGRAMTEVSGVRWPLS